MLKKITMLLALVLATLMLVSCGGGDTEESKNPLLTDENAPSIPATLDISGEFHVLVAGYKGNDFEGTAESTTSVESAIYKRNELIKELYGVEVTNEAFLGYGTTNGTGNGFQKIYTGFMSGSSDFDAAMIGTGDVANLAQNSILWDLSSLPYMDLSKPYWDQKANEDLAVAGKMFYTTGEIGVVDNIYTHALLFNKDLIESYQMESPYELVRNNEWTLETLGRLAKQVGQDVDNNGVYDEKDMYGLMIWNDPMVAMLAGAGEKIATVNESGEIELSLYSERVVNLYDALQNLVFDQQHVYNYQYDNVTGKAASISTWDTNRFSVFNENRVLFNFGALSLVESHRDSEVDFGILPYPKLDATQADYGHVVSGFHTQFFCIPLMADPERSSAVSELLAFYGEEYLTPAYYEKTLCGKYVRDEESTEMLDIIFDSHVFDIGVYYDIGGYFDEISSIFVTRKSISTIYETYRTMAESQIKKLNESFAQSDNVVYGDTQNVPAKTEAVEIDTTPYSDATVVYLATGGKGNGSNAQSAVDTMTKALDCLDLSKDCTVVVCGKYVQEEHFVYTKTFEGSVTVTSNYDGVDYRTKGAEISAPAVRFVCSGEYIFRDIEFSLIGNFYYFIANHYPFTLDTGVEVSSMSNGFTGTGFANAFSISGGSQAGQPVIVDGEPPVDTNELDVNITVKSGYNICIGAYSRGIAGVSYTGTANITVGGDAVVSKLYLTPVNGAFTAGNAILNVQDNGTVSHVLVANDGGTAESVTVNWMGGNIAALDRAKEGVTLTLNGGMHLTYAESVASAESFAAVSAAFDSAVQQ